MTTIHLSEVQFRKIRGWKLTGAQKERLHGVVLIGATLGMLAVFVVRFSTLFTM